MLWLRSERMLRTLVTLVTAGAHASLPTSPSLVFTNGMGGVPCFRIPSVTTTNIGGELLAFAGAYCQASTDGWLRRGRAAGEEHDAWICRRTKEH